MTTDVCEVCGGGLAKGCNMLDCRNYEESSYTPCANAEDIAISRAAEIERLRAVNSELVAALGGIVERDITFYNCYVCDGEIHQSLIFSGRQALANATNPPR